MKKIKAFICFIISLVIIYNANFIFAIDINSSANNNEEMKKQEKIDNIFTDLNNIALEKKISNTLDKQDMFDNISCDSIENRKNVLEIQLQELGVHKLDPNNIDDINRISDIVYSSMNSNGEPYRGIFDFSMLTSVYSIYEYTGTYSYKSNSYEYKYIRVVDNKGYVNTTLTNSKLLVPVGTTSTILSTLLGYTFKFGFSAFLGTLPSGWAIDYTMGAIFDVLKSYNGNSSVVCSNNSGIYCMNITSVTEMTYYYIKVNGNWYNSGTRAGNVSMARVDSFSGNINGVAVPASKIFPTTNISTGNVWYWYIERFVDTTLPTHHSIGSFSINRSNGSALTFAPCYIQNPLGLI